MGCGLESLHLRRYRGFRDFRLGDLGRVNLIVGKNNAGKTSLLEAIRLLTSGEDIEALYQIAVERGETVVTELESPGPPESRCENADISHFFYGHEFGLTSEFLIDSGNGAGSFKAEIADVASLSDSEYRNNGQDDRLLEDIGSGGFFALRLFGASADGLSFSRAFVVTEDGGLPLYPSFAARPRIFRRMTKLRIPPTVVITPASFHPSVMARMWERIAREKRENDAIDALKILEPDIEDIQFFPGERLGRVRGGALIGLRDSTHRVPLGSMGEGMRRVLALAIGLSQSRKGLLLIDEIDAGLHWSIMSRMWELTIRTAQTLGVQVFATTHSLDCLRGMKDAVDEHVELADQVRVHKIDSSLETAVTFTSGDLAIAIDQEIEVRG